MEADAGGWLESGEVKGQPGQSNEISLKCCIYTEKMQSLWIISQVVR